MKAFQKISFWRTIFLLATVIFFFSCKPGDDPNDPTDPDDPTPIELVKPVVKSLTVENVTTTSAKISAWVTPNEKGTKVYVEYKKTTETAYHSQALAGDLSGKDSLKVSFDVVLTANNEYVAHIKAVNKAGDSPALTDVKFSTSVVTDYDGNVYHVIKIGNQYWLQENLKATHYADGTVIPNVSDEFAWAGLSTGAYCYYNNDPSLGKIYGALYNWYAAVDSKGFIPGYHLPSPDEFMTLSNYFSDDPYKAAAKLCDASGKYWHFVDGYLWMPDNSSGFTALPAGTRYYLDGKAYFDKIGYTNYFYTSSKWEDANYISVYEIMGNIGGIRPKTGVSVRLIKD